ncbi:hypothetical protein CJ030_MR7G012082 [Morella rubra]|uniref:Uncharacterized protein n=1 Tax=Morella rubra TaxID=262757 RepID=A0A6A1UY19_9ROSI|nr:hypothetical protein CJ030_MR7G012082 [Morella rubra]
MESLVGCARAAATGISRPPLTCASRKKINGLKAKLRDDNDPLLQTTINAVSLRSQATHRSGRTM